MVFAAQNIKTDYMPQALAAVPVYDETMNSRLSEVIRYVIVSENIHETSKICKRVQDHGIPCSDFVIFVRLQNDKQSFVEMSIGFWEHKKTLVKNVVNFILDNKSKLNIRSTRSMPEITDIIRPGDLVNYIPRYAGKNIHPRDFSKAVADSSEKIRGCELIVTNKVIVNFKEAFIKDIYNVILRERKPLSSREIALRLFSSKIGVYKKSLKFFISRTGRKDKTIHYPLNSHEMVMLSRLVERTVRDVVAAREYIFIVLKDGKINAYRNHIGVIKIKLTEENQLVVNMLNENEVYRNVSQIIDSNLPFLSKLIRQFRNKLEEDEVKSRFYQKVWQAIVQYDDIWGHKFHTFLHRALKNILLDDQTKQERVPQLISLNSIVNDKNNEELGNIVRDKEREMWQDPAQLIFDTSLVEMVEKNFPKEQQQVLFAMMDGLKDRDIATSLNKSIDEISIMKKKFKSNKHLLNWISPRDITGRSASA